MTGEFETESRPRRCRRDLTGEEKGEGASGAGDGAGVGVGARRVFFLLWWPGGKIFNFCHRWLKEILSSALNSQHVN